MDAIVYVDRTGVPWRYLPADFPPWQTVYRHFVRWEDQGVTQRILDALRRRVRGKAGRDPEPSACVIDAQSVKTSANVPAAGQGVDAAKKIVGRKRSIATDILGLLLAVLVTAAGVRDSVAGASLLDQLAADHPTVGKAWVDGGYCRDFIDHAATLGIGAQVVPRDSAARGFTVLPRRWVAERTLGRLMHHRRLARDYEALPATSEAMIHLAIIDTMTRRLTGGNTPNWRGT